MSRLTSVRGAFAVLTVLICGPAFATAYTSNQSGDWDVSTTWSPTAFRPRATPSRSPAVT